MRAMKGQLASRVNIAEEAMTNDAFRREVETGDHEQVVVMTIPPGSEIGEEVHPGTDQVLVFVDGEGEAHLGAEGPFRVGAYDLVFVRAGTRHNFVNTGPRALRLFTTYAPPQHPPGTVHQTKADADAAEHDAGSPLEARR